MWAAMLPNVVYYRLKAEEFDAKADAEQEFDNIRQAYRKLAEDYRKLADQTAGKSPSLVPGQGRLL